MVEDKVYCRSEEENIQKHPEGSRLNMAGRTDWGMKVCVEGSKRGQGECSQWREAGGREGKSSPGLERFRLEAE